jgi:hypothetical protein
MKEKVLIGTKDLKNFFSSREVTVSDMKEILYRMIDYIDQNYDEDKLDVIFKNGNIINGNSGDGKDYKHKIHQKGIKLEVKAR